MSYITVLPLATMKTYLRIDDTQSVTDSEITSMINSALSYIEKHTNVMVYARDKEFIIKDRCVRVYDTPINSVVKGIDDDDADVVLTYKTNYDKEEKNLYTNYTGIDGSAVKLVLNVGYESEASVPTEIIDLAKKIVDIMYNEDDGSKSFKEMLPMWANEILATNKRFIL